MNKFIKVIGLCAMISVCATSVMASDNLEEVQNDETIIISLGEKINQSADNKNILTLERAIVKAIDNDDTIAMYKRTLNLYNEQIKYMDDYGSKVYLLKVIDIEELEYNIEKMKDIIEKNVTDQYNNIIIMNQNIKILESQIKINENNLKKAELQKNQGYIDQASYDKVEKALDNSISTKNQTERTLKDVKNSFYQLTLFDANDYNLQAVDEYTPYSLDINIDAYADGMATKMLKYKAKKVKLDEDKLWQEFSDGGRYEYEIYLGMQNNLANSKANLESKHDTYANNIGASYTAFLQQKEIVETKIKELETINNDYKALEIRYKHGYISEMDYKSQKLSIESKEVECLREVNRYNILKMEIEKPWTQSWALME